MDKFDYIVNFWFGPRSSVKEFRYEKGKGAIQATNNYGFWYHKLHHYFLVHAHCKFLSKNKIPNLNRIQFVINVDKNTNSVKVMSEVREIIQWYKLDVNIMLHDNTNHSYGAWNAGLKNLILHNTKSRYCFLCEDDYVPTDKDFYLPFFKKFNTDHKLGYVCQYKNEMKMHVVIPKKEDREEIENKINFSSSREVKMDTKRLKNRKEQYLDLNNIDEKSIHVEYTNDHAAISNGFISMEVAKRLAETGDIFTFELVGGKVVANDLAIRAQEQIVFTNKVISSGYTLGDISEECYTPFDENNNNKIKKYGKEDGYCPIKPYKYPEIISLSKMNKNDLQWFLEIRNDDSTRHYLENNNKFTLDEAEKWFDNLDKDELYPYLIISGEKSGDNYGYVRQYMTEINGEKMVEIGVDIHPQYRKKGIARAAYVTLLRDLDKASLWVFEDNFARNLYFDLGFRDTGETAMNRGRKNYRMVWKRKI